MNIEKNVSEIAAKFVYLSDKKSVLGDFWFVMKSQEGGTLYGDCDDFSISALWLECDRNLWKFIWNVIILHRYKLYRCKTTSGEYHVIGRVGDLWFDNWTLSAVDKETFFARTKHKILHIYPSPVIAYFMLMGLLIDQDSRLSKIQS